MNIFKIKDLCEKREGGLTKLSQDIGMSIQNLHRCIRLNKIQAQDLEQIAYLLGVPITYFFNDAISLDKGVGHQINGSGNKISGHITLSECKSEVEYLKMRLEEKERLLQEKERFLQEKERFLQEKERLIQILISK